MKTLREYIDIISEQDGSINDAWFKSGSFQTYKKPNKERYEIAQTDGVIDPKDALESQGKPVPYKAGWYIMTGPKGEKYTFPPEEFHKLKDDEGNGVVKRDIFRQTYDTSKAQQ